MLVVLASLPIVSTGSTLSLFHLYPVPTLPLFELLSLCISLVISTDGVAIAIAVVAAAAAAAAADDDDDDSMIALFIVFQTICIRYHLRYGYFSWTVGVVMISLLVVVGDGDGDGDSDGDGDDNDA